MAHTAPAKPTAPLTAEQSHISLGFIFLYAADGETYTVRYDNSYHDGIFYTRTAEHILGGNHKLIRFRFIR